jgi:uncharacterized protein YjgD (DUF1641 family)
MNIDNATTTYRLKKLEEELESMAEDYSETLDDARNLGASLATLKLLELIRQVNYDCHDLDEIIEVAIKTLPNNTDSSPTEPTLKGARALHGQLSNKLWKLAGLVTLQVQAAATQPPGATH